MPKAAEIVERVRSLGANIMVDGDKLSIQNRNKLTPEAIAYVRKHAEAIADFLCHEFEIDEAAASIEIGAGMPKEVADYCARVMIEGLPKGLPPVERSYFITAIGRIIDEVYAPAIEMARAA